MRLLTTIPPRLDGTVRVAVDGGRAWVFEQDADGLLSCEVDDPAFARRLLSGGLFMLAPGEDSAPAGEELPVPSDSEDQGADDDDADDDDADGADDAQAPDEAHTPPATIPGTRKGRARKPR